MVEATAAARRGGIVYDPTDGIWLDLRVSTGHAASIAIRAEVPRALSWGPVVLVNGQWAEVAGG